MKSTTEIFPGRIVLTLSKLADFDAEYPAAEEDAIARSINLVDIYRGSEFITQINVELHQKTFAAYTYRQLAASSDNFEN